MTLALLMILLLAGLLRFIQLDLQSLWLDELHTMIEADPSKPWSHLFFYIKCCDIQPPLFFFIEKFMFALFGHTALVARIFPAVFGVGSVYMIYRLGTELRDRHLGIVAALLLSVNYFGIWYSQDARGYSQLAFMSILAYFTFIRLVKQPGLNRSLVYAVACILLVYSHYYGLMLMISQVMLAGIFLLILTGEKRKAFIRYFVIAGVVAVVAYLPWLPFLLSSFEIRSFWIGPVSPDFAVGYFFEFFGDSGLLNPFLILFLILFSLYALTSKSSVVPGKLEPSSKFGFLIILIWFTGSLIVPYVRSELVVPMICSRYAIIVLPATVLAVAFGIISIRGRIVRRSILGIFVALSLIDVVVVKQYYQRPIKTQFREMLSFVAKSPGYPIVNEVVHWHIQYYLEHFDMDADLLSGSRMEHIKAFIAEDEYQGGEGFWLIGAHGETRPHEEVRSQLDEDFLLLKSADFLDAWADLYVAKSKLPNFSGLLDYRHFQGVLPYESTAGKEVPIWSHRVMSDPIYLDSGHYEVVITCRGNEVDGEFPVLQLHYGDVFIGHVVAGAEPGEARLEFVCDEAMKAPFRVELLNDYYDPGSNRDRNAFIKTLYYTKKEGE